MQRRDYITLSIAINRAVGRILLDESLSGAELIAIRKYHRLLVDEMCENIKLENSAFDREKFLKLIQGYSSE